MFIDPGFCKFTDYDTGILDIELICIFYACRLRAF